MLVSVNYMYLYIDTYFIVWSIIIINSIIHHYISWLHLSLYKSYYTRSCIFYSWENSQIGQFITDKLNVFCTIVYEYTVYNEITMHILSYYINRLNSVYIIQCTMNSVHCILYNIQYCILYMYLLHNWTSSMYTLISYMYTMYKLINVYIELVQLWNTQFGQLCNTG